MRFVLLVMRMTDNQHKTRSNTKTPTRNAPMLDLDEEDYAVGGTEHAAFLYERLFLTHLVHVALDGSACTFLSTTIEPLK
jgi:hypothetical protein